MYTQFKIYHSPDSNTWSLLADLTSEKRDRPNAYIELKQPVHTRYLKYVHEYVASPNLAISDIRVFGRGPGAPPNTPLNLQVRRDSDERNAFITWDEVPGAVGYNVLWGIDPNKLYQTYQVFADQGANLELRALRSARATISPSKLLMKTGCRNCPNLLAYGNASMAFVAASRQSAGISWRSIQLRSKLRRSDETPLQLGGGP